jgi:DNA mismatch repair protein MutS
LAATPMIKQYLQIKQEYQDTILFYRMGDFYEMFFEDAVIASRELEIVLTSRDRKSENGGYPFCGIPHHAATAYIDRLIKKGYKVAICDQVEDAKKAKGLVKRDVVRVITPGVTVEEGSLDAATNNYIAAARPGKPTGFAYCDFSTGEFRACRLRHTDEIFEEIDRLGCRQLLLPEGSDLNPAQDDLLIEERPGNSFATDKARRLLHDHFEVSSLASFGIDDNPAAIGAAGALLQYLKETQKQAPLDHINSLSTYAIGQSLILDSTSRRNLEIFQTISDLKRKGSLLGVLDMTITSPGARMLARWIAEPLTDVGRIRRRQDAIEELIEDAGLRQALRDGLKQVADIERLTARASVGSASPRDLAALGRSLAVLPALAEILLPATAQLITDHDRLLGSVDDLAELLMTSMADEPPLTVRDGGIIAEGINAELDELRGLARNTKKVIAALEADEKQKSGIPSLKIGFNRVFGYYLEVTNTHRDLVPPNFIRKQTLVNAERYITPELKELEEKILSADDKSKSLEYDLFIDLRHKVAARAAELLRLADFISRLDVLAGLAEIAVSYGYVRPVVADDDLLEIKDGRHPVVERLSEERFVPNDTVADCGDNRMLIITGPNMAGKSTYMRQVALIVLMAQIGSYVPASEAHIGVVDRIFTRVGAADNLAGGLSTFMVEMTETGNILHHATGRSLIILDEIGRGTSTFDGLSIAWAVAEYIHDKIGARTLFATHYHELTDLSLTKPGVKNYNVSVKEYGDQIIFLRRIVTGGASRSYGIAVAKLAGIPNAVVKKAKSVLERLESQELSRFGLTAQGNSRRKPGSISDDVRQTNLFGSNTAGKLERELAKIDVNQLTPLDALSILSELKKKAEEQ